MMNFILFDSEPDRGNLLPFTFTRPISEIRCGILTIAQKWEQYLATPPSFLTQSYLEKKFPLKLETENIFINGALFPNQKLVEAIKSLTRGQSLHQNGVLLAAYAENWEVVANTTAVSYEGEYVKLSFTYDIFSLNAAAIEADFKLLTNGRKSAPIPESTQYVNAERIFIEPGAKVQFAILNASEGCIYIGKDAEVMEGSKIRGPFALGEHATVKMDAKIYGGTSIGPYCKVGGEISNAVFFAYSNKGHDGFIGNSVIGEWCNLGADTNNSNLKNTYEEVKLWNYRTERFEKTGLTFCGLMMADHAKCGINTMFNTGTVVGVAANVFGAGFPRNFIPSFAWGGAQGFETFILKKAFVTAKAMCSRRGIDFDEVEQDIMKAVYDESAKYRFWERVGE